MYILISTQHKAFWELIGFRLHQNSKVKRDRSESNSRMGDPLGSSYVSSYKQNREGVVGAQLGQYHATVEPRLGCDRIVSSHFAVWCKCADEDVGPLRGVDCNIPHHPGEWIL